MWIRRDYSGNDEVFVINGALQIKHINESIESLEVGQMCTLDEDAITNVKEITRDMLPKTLYHKLEINRLETNRGSPFTLFTPFIEDLNYKEAATGKMKIRKLTISMKTGMYLSLIHI